MSVLELNNVKVFNLSSGKSLSQFIADSIKTKKSLRSNIEYKNRLELIQDFEFPTASSRVHVSQDSEYFAACGVYPPQLRLFETSDLSMKFQRNLDSEIVDFTFLTSDYKKLAILCSDRSIELHAQYGKHYSTRIPRFGRDLAYNSYNCELLIVGATPETYRLNLEQGRFMGSLESSVCSELNVCTLINELNWIVATAGCDGFVESWDLRQRERAALLDCKSGEITALSFEKLLMGVGHSCGAVNVFDIRFPKPMYTITHKNRMPVKAVAFHEQYVLSTDFKALKISDQTSGAIVTTIESEHPINDFEVVKDTGMVFVANETERVGIFYIPTLGNAPKWCSFVEGLNDEVQELKPSLVQNKQFVTIEELEKLNGSDLIGSEMVTGYMHGYLIDSKLYYKLKALADPFDYKEYRKERIAKKLEEKTAERITIKKKLPKVNKTLAAELMKDDRVKKGKEILEDTRFGDLFTDKNYEINQESEDFRRLNRKKLVEPADIVDNITESEEDLPIIPNLNKKKKIESNLVVEPDEDGKDQVFKDRIDEKVSNSKVHRQRIKKSKILKEKPDLTGRRAIIPMHKLLKSSSKRSYK
jgi:ribosome biogenesis protein ENP2